jgi:cytochrome c biogenesis protein CcmG/thiol:disulfide interchange protein DsbE
VRRPGARLVAVVLTALALLLAGCTSGGLTEGPDTPASSPPAASGPLEPCPAQPAESAHGAQTLPKLAFSCSGGGALDLSRAPGVPTVVTLWGSWCEPCRDELPIMQQLSDQGGNHVRVVGVISKDGLPQANSFATDAHVTFPSAVDGDGKLMAGVGINVLPYTYFLDANGAVTYTQVGPVGSLDELRQLVATHLGVQQ